MEKQPAANAVRSNGNVAFSRFFGEAARMGRADLVELCLSRNSYFKETGPYPRAWQPHGIVSEGLSQALLQSLCASPGADPVIRVFPAWPASRDACFSLRAKGDFLVTSAMRAGQISFVEIQPARGGVCRLRNPWGKEQAIQVWRDGKKNELLTGSLLTLETKAGGDLVLTIQDTTLHKLKLNLP